MDKQRLRKLAGLQESVELIVEMDKPTHGKMMGSTDGDELETHDAEEMSRVADLLWAATQVGGANLRKKVADLLPTSIKGEFTHSKWKYQEHR
jgi:hypothetical protein